MNTALDSALQILDDLPDPDLIETAVILKEDYDKARERWNRAQGALMRRMGERNATVLVDGDGQIAVELSTKRTYEWDSDALFLAIGERDAEKLLKWMPGRYVPQSTTALNNLIKKLGNDPKARLLESARKVTGIDFVKIVDR